MTRRVLVVAALAVGLVVLLASPTAWSHTGAESEGPVASSAHGPDETAAVATSDDGEAVRRALTVVRLVSFVALALLCGGLAFVGGIWPEGGGVRRARALLWVACALGAASAAGAIVLTGASARRLGFAEAVRPTVVRAAIGTPVGQAWMASLLLYVLAVALLWTLSVQGAAAARSLGWRVGAVAVGLGLLRTPGLAGHASEGAQAALGSIADWAHVAGASVWLGGLAMLCVVVLPRRQVHELAQVVPRFSTLAAAAVGTIVVGGLVLAWQLVGGFDELVSTRYGQVLLVKTALFAVVLGVAFQSKAWVDRRLELAVLLDGDRAVLGPFVRVVATEAVLVAGVLTAAAVLVSTSPAR